MATLFLQIGILNLALLILFYYQIHPECDKFRDSLLFSRLMLSCMAVLFIDTLGWVIDGQPLGGQLWFTTIVDGLDLWLTTLVCWCWVKYALYINDAEKADNVRWYNNLEDLLLFFQTFLVGFSQYLGIYYYIDAAGRYIRGEFYFVHTLISVGMLIYSSAICFQSYLNSAKKENRNEKLFVAVIIFIPIIGNVFQQFIYGYPTIWLCMEFMIAAVYIHIQNKRNHEERESQNVVLRRALAKAESANAAKTAFLSRMSHDMRTPLNGILGLTAFMQERVVDEATKKDLADLEVSGKFLLNIINDTLDVSRIESGKLELHESVWNEKEFWSDVLKLAHNATAPKNINLHTDIKAGDNYVFGDRGRLFQIIMNIIGNAVKFTPSGGHIYLSQEYVWERFGVIKASIAVQDTGIGMSKTFLPHIFEPFTQEDSSRTSSTSGTGLGMSIVKQLLELMHGNIFVESEQGKGSLFTIRLELKKASEEQVANWRAGFHKVLPEVALAGKKILICEDHPLNFKIAERLLQAKGVQVEHAVNGKEGVEMFVHSPRGYYDMVLMDIRMPLMDGLEATKRIRDLQREDGKTIPIIAMTANAFAEDIAQTKAAGMNDHLSKPIDREQFYKTLIQHFSK